MSISLHEIHSALGGTLHAPRSAVKARTSTEQNDPNTLLIHRLQSLKDARAGECSFLSNPRYRSQLTHTQAQVVIVPQEAVDAVPAHAWAIEARQPYAYYARLSQLLRKRSSLPQFTGHIHPSAVTAPTALIHPTVHIGANAVVEDNAHIDAHTIIRAGAVVGYNCQIGKRCIVHSGAVIGADGFGFAPEDGAWVKIEQLGAVRIGDDVEIGANTCIDRGALSDTCIEDGVKLDNLIQIAHNVHIGAHTAMAACVGIAGSARIGAHCTIGGGAIVLGHLSIPDHTHISAASVVSRSIRTAGNYSGFFPLDENKQWERNAAALKQLYQMRQTLRRIERK